MPILLEKPVEEASFGLRIAGDLFVELVVVVNHLGKELFGDLVEGETGGLGWVDLATLLEGNVPRQFALKMSDGGRGIAVDPLAAKDTVEFLDDDRERVLLLLVRTATTAPAHGNKFAVAAPQRDVALKGPLRAVKVNGNLFANVGRQVAARDGEPAQQETVKPGV